MGRMIEAAEDGAREMLREAEEGRADPFKFFAAKTAREAGLSDDDIEDMYGIRLSPKTLGAKLTSGFSGP